MTGRGDYNNRVEIRQSLAEYRAIVVSGLSPQLNFALPSFESSTALLFLSTLHTVSRLATPIL